MKNLFHAILVSLIVAGLLSCGGGSGGESTDPSSDITEEVSTAQLVGDMKEMIEALGEHSDQYLTTIDPGQKNLLKTFLAAGQLSLDQTEQMLKDIREGKSVVLPVRSGDGSGSAEEVEITLETLAVVDELIQTRLAEISSSNGPSTLQYRHGVSSPKSVDLISPSNIAVICEDFAEKGEKVLDYLTYATGLLCEGAVVNTLLPIADEALACSAHALLKSISAFSPLSKGLCMAYPTILEDMEIYPEKPCIKQVSDLHPDGETIQLTIEGEFKNQVEKDEILEEVISGFVDKIFKPVTDTLGTVESVLDPLKWYFVEKATELAVDAGKAFGIDLGSSISPISGIVYPIDGRFVEWKVGGIQYSNQELLGGTATPIFHLLGNQLESADSGGVTTIQAEIKNWPNVPDKTFKSRARKIRVSGPPELVDFEMTDMIGNYNYEAYDGGTITVRDEDLDFHWATFTQITEAENPNPTAKDVGFATGFAGNSQTDKVVTIHVPGASPDEDSLPPGVLPMNARHEHAGRMQVHLFLRDTCGNKVYEENLHTFRWNEPVCWYIGCAENDDECFDRNNMSCSYPQSECAVAASLCWNQPEEAFTETIKIATSDNENWDGAEDLWVEAVHDDGTVGPRHQLWIDILKERDADE